MPKTYGWLLCCLTGALLAGCSASVREPLVVAPHGNVEPLVIFPAALTRTLSSDLDVSPPNRVDGYWTPSAGEARVVELQVRAALHAALAADSVLTADAYRLQLFGIVSGGVRLIFINGFHEHLPHALEMDTAAWRREPISNGDACRLAFTIVFDVGSQRTSRLHFADCPFTLRQLPPRAAHSVGGDN